MMDAPKLIAITGGTGFLGRSVVRCLLEQNDHSVRALTRRPQTLGGVEWIGGDLTDHSALEALCAGADTVIHIAGLTKARKLQHLLDVNEHGAASAAKAAQAGGVKRFILISSIAAREPDLSHYAFSKRAGETALQNIAKDMELLIIRPPAIIGAGDDAIRPMLDVLKRGYLPAPSGRAGRTGKMSFVHVDDVARFIVQTINTKPDKSIVTPHGATPATGWQDLADAASAALGQPVKVIPIPPFLLKIAAFFSQTANSMLFRSGFFNSGKVRELLHIDWTGDTEIGGSLSLEETFQLTFQPNSTKHS